MQEQTRKVTKCGECPWYTGDTIDTWCNIDGSEVSETGIPEICSLKGKTIKIEVE